jgi:hypothetical protein
VPALHATDRLTLGSFFGLDLPKKQIGRQPSQPRNFELEFGDPVVGIQISDNLLSLADEVIE